MDIGHVTMYNDGLERIDLDPMIIVSACLVGLRCRYDGSSCSFSGAVDLVRQGLAIPVCPEQLGGLSTPRPPCEIVNGRVLTELGGDMTDFFLRGVEEALSIVDMLPVKMALLKEKSPSCGVASVYDGSFSGSLREGQGLFAAALYRKGVAVFSENNFIIENIINNPKRGI